MSDYDIHFYWDPVCPFAWLTSRWVEQVCAQKDYRVDWRFISLRIVNKNVDYDAQFPPEYEAGHTSGLRMLRVAARTRAEHGRDVARHRRVGSACAATTQRESVIRPFVGTWPKAVVFQAEQTGTPRPFS